LGSGNSIIYNVDVFINNTEFTVEPSIFSFSMKDSIHKLYPELNFTMADRSGIFLEYLTFAEGNDIKIQYGFDNDIIENKYVFVNNNLDKIYESNYINGQVTCLGIHEYFKDQNVISQGYFKRISNIVQEKIATYTFKGSRINSTGNNDYWYQPLMTDADFMTKLLLPNAYSNNSFDTPFFMFIGNDNYFNLRNYKDMFQTNPVKDIYYIKKDPSKYTRDNLINFQKMNNGSSNTEKIKNRLVFSYSRDTSELLEEQDAITDYPNDLKGSIPILSNDNVKSIVELGYEESDIGRNENVLGRKVNSMKESFFIERLILTIPLDVNINAGSTINFKVPNYLGRSDTEESVFYGGKYLVEESEHVWSGKDRNGFSVLTVSRKDVKLNNTYKLKEKLF
jgi:hypothetical protein